MISMVEKLDEFFKNVDRDKLDDEAGVVLIEALERAGSDLGDKADECKVIHHLHINLHPLEITASPYRVRAAPLYPGWVDQEGYPRTTYQILPRADRDGGLGVCGCYSQLQE